MVIKPIQDMAAKCCSTLEYFQFNMALHVVWCSFYMSGMSAANTSPSFAGMSVATNPAHYHLYRGFKTIFIYDFIPSQ